MVGEDSSHHACFTIHDYCQLFFNSAEGLKKEHLALSGFLVNPTQILKSLGIVKDAAGKTQDFIFQAGWWKLHH